MLNIDLIPKTINNQKKETVNARELWKKLQSKDEFSHWIKDRIEKYGFEENVDYIKAKFDLGNFSNQKKRGGDRKSVEYYITLNMAKELCMIQNNNIGRQWRKYFIECEEHLMINLKEEHKKIVDRRDMTDRILSIYGKGAPIYIYSNYTKMVYKKIFGVGKANEVRKKYNMSDKEDIRRTHKIPSDKQLEISRLEYDIACLLRVMELQKADKKTCYSRVKEFLNL